MKKDYILRSRGVSRLHGHLILVTKYRYKVITPEMMNELKEIMVDLCQKWQCHHVEGNGEADHFHLLFRFFPQTDLDAFIGNVKSVSSRRLRQNNLEYLDKIYYPKVNKRTGRIERVFWNEAYSIDSVGSTKLDVLIQYVQNQPAELLESVASNHLF